MTRPGVAARANQQPPAAKRQGRSFPAGSVESQHVAAWWRAVQSSPEIARLRADGRRNLLAVAWQLALAARPDRSTAPTWERLTQDTCLSRRTIARRLADLQAAGLLGVLETGSTPATRGHRGADSGDGHRAAVYVLCQPRIERVEHRLAAPEPSPDLSGTPRVTPVGGSSFLRMGVRKKHCLAAWSMTATTSTKSDELAAAALLGWISTDLRSLSPKWVRSKIHPWLRAGWTVADLVWAIDRAPDGTSRTWTGTAANPAPWLTARLAAWLGHPAPSVVAAQTQERQRQGQAAQRLAAGLPVLTQDTYDRVHEDARTAALEAQQPGTIDPATARTGAAACRAALAARCAQRTA